MNQPLPHPLRNRPELSLPLLDRRMVIAHYMTMMTYSRELRPNEDLFNPETYSVMGPAGHLGGMCQHIPLIAHYFGKSASLEESVAHEIRSAVELGVDGFQFYFPDRFDAATRRDCCRIITSFLKVAARDFPGFKLTVCPSHPESLTEEENIREFAISLNRILAETRGLDSWLKTPDGRTIIYLWAPDGIVESVRPPDRIREHPERMANVAEAYERLAAACGIRAAFIYHIRDDWANDRALLEHTLDYFPAVWGFVPTSDPGDGWEQVHRRCIERGRSYTQSVFNDFYTSKFHFKEDEWRLALQREECAGMTVDDFWKRYLPCGLSNSFRRQLQRAVDWDVPIINLVTWNDYPEGHHLAPEVNREFGFALLLKHFKNLWLGRPEANDREWTAVFYKKYRSDVRPVPFEFEIRLLREEQANDDSIEVISWLLEPARLWINDTECGIIGAGLRETRIPSEPGHIRVRLERDGAEALSLTTAEAITDHPFRTDLTTCTASSEFQRIFERLFPGQEPVFSTEYATVKRGTDLHRHYATPAAKHGASGLLQSTATRAAIP